MLRPSAAVDAAERVLFGHIRQDSWRDICERLGIGHLPLADVDVAPPVIN